VEEEVTETRLVGFEAAALAGADELPDEELAGALAEAIDRHATAVDRGSDTERVQDLRELAAVALITARRLTAEL
jgi:hypothetical protein